MRLTPSGTTIARDLVAVAKLGPWLHAAEAAPASFIVRCATVVQGGQGHAMGTLVTGDGRMLPSQLDQAGRAQVAVSPSVSVYLGSPGLPFRR